MKTLSKDFRAAAAPKLSGEQLKKLSDTIESFLTVLQNQRRDRVKKILTYRAMHRDDYSHRLKEGGIWMQSNIGVPLMKGVATSYHAKVEDELFSSDQPFQAMPEGSEDKMQAEKLSKYWNWELMSQVKYDQSGSEMLNVVTSEGTAITKRRWRKDRSWFTRVQRQLLNESGEPVLLPDGSAVMPDHETVKVPKGLVMGIVGTLLGSDTNETWLTDKETGEPVLKLEASMSYEDVELKDSITHYENAESVVIPFEDFWCDMSVDNLNKSPFVGHAYSRKIYEIWEMVFDSLEDEMGDGGLDAALEGTGWVAENLRKLKDLADVTSTATDGEEGSKTAAATAPISSFGEGVWKMTGILIEADAFKTCQLMEGYMKYDLDGDGFMEDVLVIYERSTKMVIFIENLVNVYADCKPPFTAHKFFIVPGRWYGMGPYEYLECAQEFVDRVFNRMNYRTSMSANPLGWSKPDNFLVPPDKWGPGERVTLKTASNIADSMGFVDMPSLENVEWQHFNFFIQIVQLVTGMGSASQGDASSLPSSATATGITAIIEEGNKLYRMFIRQMKRTVEEDIRGLVNLVQQNLSTERVFRYNKGFQEITEIISPEDIRDLDFDVKIVLSKMASVQKSQGIQTALQTVQAFIALPPQYQIRLRDLFIQLLKIMGIVEADDVLPTVEELGTDQDKDAKLQQIAQQIAELASSVQTQNIAPEKGIAQDLAGIAQQLASMIALPPEQGEVAPPQPELAPDGGGLPVPQNQTLGA